MTRDSCDKTICYFRAPSNTPNQFLIDQLMGKTKWRETRTKKKNNGQIQLKTKAHSQETSHSQRTRQRHTEPLAAQQQQRPQRKTINSTNLVSLSRRLRCGRAQLITVFDIIKATKKNIFFCGAHSRTRNDGPRAADRDSRGAGANGKSERGRETLRKGEKEEENKQTSEKRNEKKRATERHSTETGNERKRAAAEVVR